MGRYYDIMRQEIEFVVPITKVIAEGKTVGQYLSDKHTDLQEELSENTHWGPKQAKKAAERLNKFNRASDNILHASSSVIQNCVRQWLFRTSACPMYVGLFMDYEEGSFSNDSSSEEYDSDGEWDDDEDEHEQLWHQQALDEQRLEDDIAAYIDRECNPYDN